MSKKLLSEAQVRRFAKLANLSPINEMYQDKRDDKEEMEEGYGMSHKRDEEEMEEGMYHKRDEEEMEEGYGMKHKRDDKEVMEEEAEEDVAMDAAAEMDDLPGAEEDEIKMDAEGDEDNESLASDVLSAVAGALESALGVNIEIDGGAEGDDELEMEMGDEPPMDDEMPMDEGADEIMEALRGIDYIPDNKDVVNEVARRVAKRLLRAKKAERNLQEALGTKKTR